MKLIFTSRAKKDLTKLDTDGKSTAKLVVPVFSIYLESGFIKISGWG